MTHNRKRKAFLVFALAALVAVGCDGRHDSPQDLGVAQGAVQLLPGPEQNTQANPPRGLGQKKVAVILFNFADNPVQPNSAQDVRQQLFTNGDSTNAFYNEVSFGQLSIIGHLRSDGDVFGWYTLPLTGSASDKSTPARVSDLNRLAAPDGFSAANYAAILYIHPFMNTGWAGQAFGSKEVEMDGLNRVAAAHELFHIFGIDHANGLRCTQAGNRVSISDDFSSVGYGDPFDIMGGAQGFGHPNIYFKARLGWLQTSNFLSIPRNRNQTYTLQLAPMERASSGLLGVQIAIPASRIPLQYGWGADPTSVKLFYYLEYRQRSTFEGFSAGDPVANGVSIRLGTNIDTNHMTLLVDTTPETDTFTDAPLAVGRTFSDPVAGITIRTLSVSPSGAQVEVTVQASETVSQGQHLLWSRTDGTASLWRVDASGNYLGNRYYGPIPNMTAMSYHRLDSGTAKLLWARSDGLAVIWSLDECDNVISIKRHGPFYQWTPRSYEKLSDGTARVLWSRTDGTASIWTLNGSDDYIGYKYIGPYPSWTATSYQRLPNGTAKLLWSRTDGTASIWTVDGSDNYLSHIQYGPFVNWTANGYQKLSDNSARVVWKRTDGLGSIWTLDGNDNYITFKYQGPFVDWSAQSYSER
jgi:hypothetical protein